jgi:hypothetical protein
MREQILKLVGEIVQLELEDVSKLSIEVQELHEERIRNAYKRLDVMLESYATESFTNGASSALSMKRSILNLSAT